MRARVAFLLAVVSLVSAAGVLAAVVGSVRGIVHDPQHRPIPGAEIRLKAVNSAWSQSTKSNADGEFTFPVAPVGVYNVTVTAPGFETLQEDITVAVNSSPILHFQLPIGKISERITVLGGAESTAAETVTPTTLVSSQEIQQTPGAGLTNSLKMITDYVPALT